MGFNSAFKGLNGSDTAQSILLIPRIVSFLKHDMWRKQRNFAVISASLPFPPFA